MAEKIKFNRYDVSFTFTIGPEKIADIPKLEKALTEILWSLDVGWQIDKAVEASVGLVLVHSRGRISHMQHSIGPVKIVPLKTGHRGLG